MPLAYGTLAALLVVAVVAVAYGTAAPSFGVAEFAPAGRQVEAPPSTDTPLGADRAGGRAGRGRVSTTTTAAPPATDAGSSVASASATTRVGRARTCVGNPPRQVDDPQSPPCVPFIFDGDNGGATARGVSATEIKVAVDRGYDDGDGALQALFDYFNLHFEFYGRRLVPIVMPYNVQEAVQQRATAAEISAAGAFAASGRYPNHTLPTVPLLQALAREGVIALNAQEYPYGEEALLGPFHPFIWSINASPEEVWATTGELICKALAGRPAAHAGTALATSTREFGLIAATNVTATMPMTMQHRQLIDRANECGVEIAIEVVNGSSGTDFRPAVEKLRAGGVTTVICACYYGVNRVIAAAREVGGYEPEIMLPNLGWLVELLELDLQGASVAAHARHVFGVYQGPKLLPYQVRPAYAAIRQLQPNYALKAGGEEFKRLESLYKQLLVLASGIQGAGPNLRPESFAQALMTTQFSNPGAGQAPFWQASVGFGPGDHTFYDDVALASWNPTLVSTSAGATNAPAGSWCFLGAGARFGPGAIPADADSRFFNPAEPCR